jgi:putative SOS response-associated peptidase YedK
VRCSWAENEFELRAFHLRLASALGICALQMASSTLYDCQERNAFLAFRSDPLMDQQGRPNESQLVYRRDPETGQPVEGLLRWGLIPHFCEKRPDFHARAETVAENEWFSDAYHKRRCVVPMNSFFQKNSSGKRYAISGRDGEPFGVAGIWENWRNPLTKMWERTFAVITVPANELVAPIHDRMLAILPTEQFPRWLSDEVDPRDLLVPFPEDQLAIKPQSSRR